LLHRDLAPSLAPLAPVEVTLDAMRQRYGDASVHGILPGLSPPDLRAGTRWTAATRIADGTRLRSLLDTAAHRWYAPLHLAAALAWKSYTYWVTLPAVLGYATAHRVPLMTAGDVLVRFHDHRPFLTVALRPRTRIAVLPWDPLAGSDAPNIRVVRDEAALLTAFRKALLDRHFEPLMARIRATVHIGRRTLLGSVASAVSYGIARSAHVLPEPPVKIAGELLDARAALSGLGIHRSARRISPRGLG
jgi:hypothetical protein